MSGSRIEILTADITTLRVDAIVNAANERLLGGGGVDGAIHHAAGPELLAACRALPEISPGVRCPTGEARITPAFNLPAKYVIHTVGPVWNGGRHGERELLANCYRNSLSLAAEKKLQSIAFPAISTGIYGFPREAAAEIALRTISAFFQSSNHSIERCSLVAFDDSAAAVLDEAHARMLESGAARG